MVAVVACPNPTQQFFDNRGLPAVGGSVLTQVSGVNFPTYSDSAGTITLPNPIPLNSRGEVSTAAGATAQLFLAANTVYTFTLFDALGNQLWSLPYVNGIQFVQTQASIGALLYPQTDAERAASVTPTNYAYPPGNVLRYGVVPNSSGAATANTTALTALCNPNNTGPTGRLVFPNTTGADVYYFNNMIQIRDGLRLDLMGTTLNFSKTYAAADNLKGWLMFIRDVTVENGSIVVNYDGSAGAGQNPGSIMRIGSRQGYFFGTYVNGIYDKTDLADMGLPPMGNITLRNLRLQTNNPNAAVASMVNIYGGLRNFRAEDIVLVGNGNAGPEGGFYYEFGYATQNGFPGTPAQWSSSHATNMVFRNITGKNLRTTTPQDGYVVSTVEAYNVLADNIRGEAVAGVFQYRIGEAHFFRPWTADATGAKRCCTVRNITSQGATATSINLNGSQPTTAGYLSDANMIAAGLAVLTPSQKVDLMRFSLDGFSVDHDITVNGPIDMRNGTASGGANPIHLQAECQRFHLLNVEALGGSSVGIRANDASVLFARNSIGTIRNCKVAGNTGPGISLANTASVLIEECQLGYSALYDPANEATQTDGVSVDGTGTNAGGVYCKGNFVTVSGAGVAYRLVSGTSTISCGYEQARGVQTFAGNWDVDGMAQTNAATIADKTSFVNNFNGAAGVTNKYLGRRCYDTSNTRVMIAQGSGATSNWVRADGASTVTPA